MIAKMATLRNSLIIGTTYDPDTDCQYVLMRVPAKDWEDYQKAMAKET